MIGVAMDDVVVGSLLSNNLFHFDGVKSKSPLC